MLPLHYGDHHATIASLFATIHDEQGAIIDAGSDHGATGHADELKAKGFALSDGPTVTGSGSLIAFIDAPEGYEVELIQRSPK